MNMFEESGVSGDRGLYARNEIVWANSPVFADIRTEPYVFFDSGVTELIAEGHTRRLSGVGLGARLQFQSGKQSWTSEVTVGRPVQQPSSLSQRETVLLATLNWSY